MIFGSFKFCNIWFCSMKNTGKPNCKEASNFSNAFKVRTRFVWHGHHSVWQCSKPTPIFLSLLENTSGLIALNLRKSSFIVSPISFREKHFIYCSFPLGTQPWRPCEESHGPPLQCSVCYKSVSNLILYRMHSSQENAVGSLSASHGLSFIVDRCSLWHFLSAYLSSVIRANCSVFIQHSKVA